MKQFLKGIELMNQRELQINPHGVKTEIVICNDSDQGVSVREANNCADPECKMCREFSGIESTEQLCDQYRDGHLEKADGFVTQLLGLRKIYEKSGEPTTIPEDLF